MKMTRKRFLLVLLALFAFGSLANAQTIALGERTPRLKKVKWLDGNAPEKCDYTYIEFIHSASRSCQLSAKRIYNIVERHSNIAFVLVSHQSASEIDSWVTDYIKPRAGVVVDDNNIRVSFGVNYAPYAVILDHKRRALWFGNPQLLDSKLIEKLTQK